jgi:hypothetical protein
VSITVADCLVWAAGQKERSQVDLRRELFKQIKGRALMPQYTHPVIPWIEKVERHIYTVMWYRESTRTYWGSQDVVMIDQMTFIELDWTASPVGCPTSSVGESHDENQFQ